MSNHQHVDGIIVTKRDGVTTEPFNSIKIFNAIKGAWVEVKGSYDKSVLQSITDAVVQYTANRHQYTVENIQDTVELVLMRNGYFDIAKAYILYRQKRAEARANDQDPDPKALEEYIQHAKYARHIPSDFRREVYAETTGRVRAMHKRKHPKLADKIDHYFDNFVDTKLVLPSMRSMQYGGTAIEANNARIYNCSFSFIDRPRVFQEGLWLLLSGCGTGYSVQYDHVDKLPKLARIDDTTIVHHVVADSIEGWADAVGALIQSFMVKGSKEYGKYVEFSYHKIRKKGEILKTSGGRAPGHLPLKRALDRSRSILMKAQGRNLRPIECHDIMCHEADAVLDGGNREAAMIALFSLEDAEMMYAKTGDWYVTHPWRARANNSVMLKRSDVKKKQFKRIFQMTREWGEPGFYFCESYDYGANPCLTGDMKLLTSSGYRTMEQLWHEGGQLDWGDTKIADSHLKIVNDHGQANATAVYRTSLKADVYEVTLDNGQKIRATPNHKFVMMDGTKVELKDLQIGDELPITLDQRKHVKGIFHYPEYALLAGWVIGDGSVSVKKKTGTHIAHVRMWNDDIETCGPVLKEALDVVYERSNQSSKQDRLGVVPPGRKWPGFKYTRADMESRVLGRLLAEDGITPGHKHQIPKSIWQGDNETIANFLKGLFSADGSVNSNEKAHTISIRLSHSSHDPVILRDVSCLLTQLGIKNKIFYNRCTKTTQLMSDGKGGKKLYNKKPNHEIIIGGGGPCAVFADLIGFIQEYKQSKVLTWAKTHSTMPTKWSTVVTNITYIGSEATYCLTEHLNNKVTVNGLVIGNCVEIGLNPRLVLTAENISEINAIKGAKYGHALDFIKPGDILTGWAFCNLCEINAAKFTSLEDFLAAAEAATFIGTLQASYTDFNYLGWVSEYLCEREALLGVSMTGMMRTPDIACNAAYQRQVAAQCIEWNRAFAAEIGVRPAARVTCVKPGGSTPKMLGIGAAGQHPDHAREYINRVSANEDQISFQAFRAVNPHMCVQKSKGKWCIEFPMKAPDTAMVKDDVSAISFLDLVKSTQMNWVEPGTADDTISPGLRHNVSNTVHVKDHEWDDVAEFIFQNREFFTGVALLSYTGDKQYAFAPFEAVVTDADRAHYRHLIANYKPVDWKNVLEDEDGTNLSGEVACAGGACAI